MLNPAHSILKVFLLLLVFLSSGLKAHNDGLTTHSTLPVYLRVTERINSLLADESLGRVWVKPLDGGSFMIQSNDRLILKAPLYLYNSDELEVLRVRGETHKTPPPSIVTGKALTDYHYEYATIRVPIDLPTVDEIEQQHDDSPLFFQASSAFSAPFLLAVPNHENAFRIRVTVDRNSLPPTSTGCYLNGIVVLGTESFLPLVSTNNIVTTHLNQDKALCTDDAQHSIQPLTYPGGGKFSRAAVRAHQKDRAEARSREPQSAPEKKRSEALPIQGEGGDRPPPERPVNYERQPPQSQPEPVDMGQLVNDIKRLSRALKNDHVNLHTKKWSQKIQFIKHRITLLSSIEKAQLEGNPDYQKCHSLLNPKDWREAIRDYSDISEQESSGRDDSSEQGSDTEVNPENHQ